MRLSPTPRHLGQEILEGSGTCLVPAMRIAWRAARCMGSILATEFEEKELETAPSQNRSRQSVGELGRRDKVGVGPRLMYSFVKCRTRCERDTCIHRDNAPRIVENPRYRYS